ncbi:hypothetical protein [Staphylococcus aureus]
MPTTFGGEPVKITF